MPEAIITVCIPEGELKAFLEYLRRDYNKHEFGLVYDRLEAALARWEEEKRMLWPQHKTE